MTNEVKLANVKINVFFLFSSLYLPCGKVARNWWNCFLLFGGLGRSTRQWKRLRQTFLMFQFFSLFLPHDSLRGLKLAPLPPPPPTLSSELKNEHHDHERLHYHSHYWTKNEGEKVVENWWKIATTEKKRKSITLTLVKMAKTGDNKRYDWFRPPGQMATVTAAAAALVSN